MVVKISSKNEIDFILNGKIRNVIILMSLPLIGNALVLKLFDLTNVFFASGLGKLELTSVLFVTPVINVFVALITAFSIAITTYLAPMYVINKKKVVEEANSIFNISFIIASIIIFLAYVFSKNILLMLNASPEILDYANIYFNFSLIGLEFDILTFFYFGLTRARGKMKITFYYTLGINIVRLILSILLVNFLSLGIVGLGIAVLVPRIIFAMLSMIKLYTIENISFNFKNIRVNRKFTSIFSPVAIDKFAMSIGFVIINAIIINFSDEVLAAFNVTNSINSIFYTPTIGLSTALITIMAQNHAAGNKQRCQQIVKVATRIILLYSAIVSVLFLIFCEQIVVPFSAGDEVIMQMSINAMRTYSWSIFGYGIVQMYFGIFYAYGKPKLAMYLSLSRLFLFRILSIVLLLSFTHLGQYSVWIGMLFSNFALLPIIWLLIKHKKQFIPNMV